MLKIFILSFKLRIIYVINEIIYSLKQIPIIGKKIPSDCYSNKPLKIIGTILAILKEIIWNMLIKKILYFLFFFLGLPALIQLLISGGTDEAIGVPFANIFIFLSIIGGFINNDMFLTNRDKYYAIFTMRINAKKYIISNYIYYLIKTVIAFIPGILLFGVNSVPQIPTKVLLLLPFIMVNIKVVVANIQIKYFQKTKKVVFEKNIEGFKIIILIASFILAYMLPILGIEITKLALLIIYLVSLIFGINGFIGISRFKNYKMMYKKLFTHENEVEKEMQDFKTNTKKASLNVITQDEMVFESNKTGYAFFNELFIKRHKKILEKKAKIQTLILLSIFIITLIITQIPFLNNVKKLLNSALLVSLPSMIYIMFILSHGTQVTQAMFMNCDHSMLTYKFYRTPKAILGLFKERLKTLIRINTMPSLIIALALPAILYATGGTDNYLNYIVLFVSIMSMSIFFSTHYLVLYYLIQPYNIESEMKSATYGIAIGVTSIGFYTLMRLQLSTIVFGSIITVFAIMYIFVSLILVYKYAPKTFKIHK